MSAGKIKTFIKNSSGSVIHEWMMDIYYAGYKQGAYDMAVRHKAEQLKENADGEGAVSSTEEVPDDREVSDD